MKHVRSMAIVLVAAAVVVTGLLPQARAAQWWKLAWTLDVTVSQPRRIMVREPGGAGLYTYCTYEITNRTGRELDIVPLVTLVTDTHKTYGNLSQPFAKAMIERRLGKPLKTSLQMMGPIKPGESRTGIVLFRSVDLKAKRWHIYVAGLSGEYVLQLIPGKADPLILHKAYHAEYRNRGDAFDPRDEEIGFVKNEWTYR